ncbi:nitrous oxidase accessory protein NosD [Arthrobacter ginsengisoli]|uniref:Nitrous oxidase accessory protein NosD n=1 Tax=Arthrobacter ginsengisoli TaxID=1356565 RepID=A0ABU1UBG1_9MICC|nr:right-handed parallel beta-helix repeat-containing protein [Arthrobacter ginsengisoli]MDR7082544.1 nitrous oxidase accessory protein NosD [Arthrobacter ginsengisoli]
MRPTRQGLLVVLAAVLLAGSGTLILQADRLWNQRPPDPVGRNEIAANGNVQGDIYPGDPVLEAQLVEREDERLIYVRAVASAARWRVEGLSGAYRLRTGSGYTLVLPARPEPYTVADLAMLTPMAFTRQGDASYLLSESIVVLPGANLSLLAPDGPEGLDIRLESTPENFVSIVTLGGSLTVAGSETADVRLTSWDSAEQAVDTRTADGRAYVRILGGHASLARANISNLGFWSGNTGGLSLTGTDDVAAFQSGPPAAEQAAESAAGAARVLPEEALAAWAARTAQDYSVVTAGIDDVTVDGNAFGLFVSNARDIVIEDSAISGSLVDGLVLHRAVTDAQITRTRSSDNAVDGFSVASSATRVLLEGVTAERNGRNGISLDGRPLADGPNAVGTAVKAYGGNRVAESTVSGNARYGIELSGGSNLAIESNLFAGNEVGVVVNHGAGGVGISRNNFTNQRLQAVAVRDAGASAAVYGNTISGGDTGIYVRNAKADITSNDLVAVSNHGITLVGDVGGTVIAGNTVAGEGSTAIRAEESSGAAIFGNNLLGWAPAYTVDKAVGSVFQPLSLVWIVLGSLLLVTAVVRRKRTALIQSPYAERVPLTTLSKGFAVPEDLAGQRR